MSARPHALPHPRRRTTRRRRRGAVWPWLLGGTIALVAAGVLALLLGVAVLFLGGRAWPGVSVAGVAVGGSGVADAEARLARAWAGDSLTLSDAERQWRVAPHALGLSLDAAASARGAVTTHTLAALVGGVDVPPVVRLDADRALAAFEALRAQLERPARNAGLAWQNGALVAVPPVPGRALDVPATVAALAANPPGALADGAIGLVMRDVAPAITDAAPLLAAAQALLAAPLRVRAYDPVADVVTSWSVPPSTWGAWVVAMPDDTARFGLRLDLAAAQVAAHLGALAARDLPPSQTLDLAAATDVLRAAVAAGRTDALLLQVRHQGRTHTVQTGDTLVRLGYAYGIPYPYLQQANPGVGALAVGQSLTIPPADLFLVRPVVAHKRVVVDLAQQRVRAYENGALLWDWPASTGIADSPTWPGVYQVTVRERNAYAGNWALWMPHFLGIYQPVPGSNFTNGFHGFPTRAGGQVLWANSLGRPATFGCIMVSDANAALLYAWAEDGVVVQIVG